MDSKVRFSNVIAALAELYVSIPQDRIVKPWGYSFVDTAEHDLITEVRDQLFLLNT